jgi:hypothetical protein
MSSLIGFLGGAGSGKDTAGRILVQEHGYYSLAFADPIKLFCMWMFAWSAERLWGSSELRNKEDRTLLFHYCDHCGSLKTPDEVLHGTTPTQMCLRCQKVPADKQRALSPRFALQHLGTEWARALNPRCHVDFLVKRAAHIQLRGVHADPIWSVLPEAVHEDRWKGATTLNEVPRGIYVSDCRFRNEVDGVRSAGGKVYRITRKSTEDTTTTGILDGVIENSGSMDTLRKQISEIVRTR